MAGSQREGRSSALTQLPTAQCGGETAASVQLPVVFADKTAQKVE